VAPTRGGVFGDSAGVGLCRRSYGSFYVCGDDVRHKYWGAAGGILPLSIIATAVALPLLLAIGTIVGSDHFESSRYSASVKHGQDYSNTYEIGKKLFTDYVWPFEIAAVILLVAIVAAIALTLRTSRQVKTPNVEEQLAVRREDRVRLIDIETE
jgi:NADH-quinone oxidoreductase subunit J